MTYPRSHLVDQHDGGVYHVLSRCVRRAWLCGVDPETRRNFSHRRAWIERRLLELADLFAISIYGYTVMSNHYHIVLEVDPQRCRQWTDAQVVDKWLTLCPGRQLSKRAKEIQSNRRKQLLGDAPRLQELRHRLGSLSWYMRFINEPLARLANREDQCTGRFWEGRFRSQQLLDEAAILACMAYVDLNPVRAGIAEDVSEADFTSARHRLCHQNPGSVLEPLNKEGQSLSIEPIALADYISLVRWTAMEQAGVRRAGAAHPALQRKQIDTDQWFLRYVPRPGCWRRAIGSAEALKNYALRIGQHWIQSGSVLHPT